MHVTFLSLGRHGRLGNQLFQIGATMGTARRNGCDYLFPEWEYSSFFAHPLPQSDKIKVESIHVEPDFAYCPVDVTVSTTLWGYYQSEKYFKHCEEELRYYLTPNDRLNEMIRECRKTTFAGIDSAQTCSVCVRRGDYVWKNGFFIELAATEYYRNAFRHFDDGTEFIVFSDEIEWCRDYFKNPSFGKYRFTYTAPPHPLAGLFLMASCRDHIIANSTFPWWGAWLNPLPEKRIVVPDSWFTGAGLDRSRTYREGGYHETKDLIPDTWKRVPVYINEW